MSKFLVINQSAIETAEIFIYGVIGTDISDNDFVQKLKEVESKHSQIKLRINSQGGSIFAGMAMYNAIKASPANIDAYIDGMAASMGSVIPLACNKVFMSVNSMLMTHPASVYNYNGTSKDLKTTAKLIDDLETIICQIYSDKTGLSLEDARQKYLTTERWINATQALQEKIIDGIYDQPKTKTAPTNIKDSLVMFNIFNNLLLNDDATYNRVQMLSDDKSDNLKSSDLISEALQEKNITSEQAIELKKVYLEKPCDLHKLLIEFADMKIKFLMGCTWKELDRSSLGEELKKKYALGFRWKRFLEFGKSNIINMNTLYSFVKDNGIDIPDNKFTRDVFNNDPAKLIERINKDLNFWYGEMRHNSWKQIEKDNLMNTLKSDYNQIFNDKYKSYFGIRFVETPKK